MDTITQMFFGATVAQAGFRRRLGRGAIAAGALVALVPDLDIAAGWIGDPFVNWVHHRGLTHSVLFGPVAGIVLGWLIWRWHCWRYGWDDELASRDARRAWIWLSVIVLMTHPIIDVLTSYGTQLLYPLTDTRFAINAMPIIDPIYSLALVAALLVGILVRARPALAQDAAAAALIFISIYTLVAWAINERVEAIAKTQIDGPAEVTAYPTLFQPVLRRVVVEAPDTVLVGFHSVLVARPIAWQRFERMESPAIDVVADTPEARILRWFSMDNVYWQAEPESGKIRVRALDYRYGLPGATVLGFWGIEATVGEDGEIKGKVQTFQPPRDTSAAAWRDLWSRILGTGPAF
ncbi:MAG: metal-dependent hydrolase [Hyphomicrobiales bacterium]